MSSRSTCSLFLVCSHLLSWRWLLSMIMVPKQIVKKWQGQRDWILLNTISDKKISLPLKKNWQHDLFTIPSKNISGCSLKHWTPAALASTHYYITDMIQNWGNHHLHQHLEDSNHALCSLEFNRLSDPPHITALGPGFTSTSPGNKILL